MCYEKSEIDFTSFNSAVIIGKVEGNDLYSNGVGKTTIFKAIEYVLFNHSNANLEKIIKEDSNFCKIIFDFFIDNKTYRITRSRTKKSSISDLSFYERNSVESDNAHIFDTDNLLWDNKTSRRAIDTEKDINNLIKLNYKSFISTVHFAQNDMSGLTTATPEKRKQILKEALQLSVYSKLEKIAKDKYNSISKKFDKNKIIIETLGDCEKEITIINDRLNELNSFIIEGDKNLSNLKIKLEKNNTDYNIINLKINSIRSDQSSTIKTIKSISEIIVGLKNSIESLTAKKSKIASQSKEIVNELKSLKENKEKINISNFDKLDDIKSSLEENKKILLNNNFIIKNNIDKINELNNQLKFFTINDSLASCKHCKQELNKDHTEKCKSEIQLEIETLSTQNKKINEDNKSLKQKCDESIQNISVIENNIKLLLKINSDLKSFEEKFIENKSIYDDYNRNIMSYKKSLEDNEIILLENKKLLNNQNDTELKELDVSLIKMLSDKKNYQFEIDQISLSIAKLTNDKSVHSHILEQKNNDMQKSNELLKENNSLVEKLSIYPLVIDSFGSYGIPAVIIQNMLDDLQVETNNLLSQLRPGLQLSFAIEKTKNDGTQDDTLDIQYLLNGKQRDYEQLSGAMKIIVTFSLKLGLSFLLQKTMGADIKILLLDEIDQPLDKAGIDALYDIIKFFQKDFTILVITHNDRMKQKFNNGILVEQDINGTSRAKVVESW